ncbi:hypothetical protein MKEN_01117700 [Mycena kentingensis (nom. inval.)]|nr:hypothetical protein MKEN_01117700 [Mycena kentingensis (nom. inval.)]
MRLLFVTLLLLSTVLSTTASFLPHISSNGTLGAPTPAEFISLALLTHPRPDRSFFWSGPKRHLLPGVPRLRIVATQLAADHDLDTVDEMLTPAARGMVFGLAANSEIAKIRPGGDAERARFVEEFWANASAAFAQLSSGRVTLMMEGDPLSLAVAVADAQPEVGSTFHRMERAVLRSGMFGEPRRITGVDRVGRDFAVTRVRVPFVL